MHICFIGFTWPHRNNNVSEDWQPKNKQKHNKSATQKKKDTNPQNCGLKLHLSTHICNTTQTHIKKAYLYECVLAD